jgi:hypothetical protein
MSLFYLNHSSLLIPYIEVFIEKVVVACKVMKFLGFMLPYGSLPCLEEPAAGCYPEPVESISHHHTLLI